MKMKSNYYLFSNFNNLTINNASNKNLLSINTFYNLTNKNNNIEPTCNFSDLLISLLGSSNYNNLILNYDSLIKKTLYCTTYTFYDENTKSNIERIFLINDDYELYELDIENLIFNYLDIKFSALPKIFQIDNKLYIYNYNDVFVLITDQNQPLILTTLPNIISCAHFNDYTLFCLKEDKFAVFAIPKTELYNIEMNKDNFSKIDLLPENGEVQKLIIYKNNIYIVQKYGISKIIIKNDNFYIQSFCSIQSKIYHDTISLIDDYIIFLTTSGLYLFDGNDIKQIFKNITCNIEYLYDLHKGLVFNNKYYLKTKLYIDYVLTSIILEFDIENENCLYFNIGEVFDINIIQNLNNYKLCATIKNENSYQLKFLDNKNITSYNKYIKFNKLCFDETPIKVLNEIKLQSSGKFKLYINSDIQNFCFDVKDDVYIKNVGIKGQFFEIIIQSETSFIIESILLKTTSYLEE